MKKLSIDKAILTVALLALIAGVSYSIMSASNARSAAHHVDESQRRVAINDQDARQKHAEGLSRSAESNATDLLPPIGMTWQNVERRFAGVRRALFKRDQEEAVTPRSELLYVGHDQNGAWALIQIGFRLNHGKQRVVSDVDIHSGQVAKNLSPAWKAAFARKYPTSSPRLWASQLHPDVLEDARSHVQAGVLEFHTIPEYEYLDNTWHWDFDSAQWQGGPCIKARPSLVLLYSPDPNIITIESEFMTVCYDAI